MRIAQRPGDHNLGELAPDHLGSPPAEDRLGRAIPVEDETVSIHQDHGVWGSGKYGATSWPRRWQGVLVMTERLAY
jgi:hypothetical protein